jgi:hypothetical protein
VGRPVREQLTVPSAERRGHTKQQATDRQEERAEKGRRDTSRVALGCPCLPPCLPPRGSGSWLLPLPWTETRGRAGPPSQRPFPTAGGFVCALNCDRCWVANCPSAAAACCLRVCAACAALASWGLCSVARAEGQRALAEKPTNRRKHQPTNQPREPQATAAAGRAAAGAGVWVTRSVRVQLE